MLIHRLLLNKIYINLLLQNMLALNKSYYIINCNKTVLLSSPKSKSIIYSIRNIINQSSAFLCLWVMIISQNKHFYAITEIKILAVYLYKYVKK